MKLKGKSAVITGASRGLGKAIAIEFLKEGADILICSRNDLEIKETAIELSKQFPNRNIIGKYSNVVIDGHARFLRDEAIKCFNKIDILVNNAGIQGPSGLIEDISFNEWKLSVEVNLFGTVNMCQKFIPHFRSHNSGRIINLSGGGAANPRPYFSPYASAKAGIVRFTETIAEELKPTPITANCIAPGALNTELFKEVLSRGIESVGPAYYEQALKQEKSGGTDISIPAKLAVFLASDASQGLTGKLISAIWDKWQNIDIDKVKNTDMYTLRRIIPNESEFGSIL